VEEGEGGCCAGDPNERGRGGGARGRVGAPGARVGRARLGWAGPLRESKPTTRTTQSETHDTGSNREPKTKTEQDEHAISDKEMCIGMMQHPWHLGFGSYMTRTLVAILV
jgi:hypothetical protein